MASFPSNKRSRKYNPSKNHWVEDLRQPATKFNNLLDPSTWVAGSTGSQPGFTHQGLTAENNIIEGYGPEGTKVPLWECAPDGSGSFDGGFVADSVAYDSSKAYRLSVFYRRTGTDDGASYFGCDSDATPSMYNIVGGAGDNSPYFISGSDVSFDGKGRLMVGYLLPHDYVGTTAIGGNYLLEDGSKDITALRSYKSNAAATTISHRALFWDVNTDIANRAYITRPRIDLIDGTEPPLALMLAHTATFTADYVDTVITGSDGSQNSMYIQTSRPDMSDGDYWIDYTTGENRVFYQIEGHLTELKPYIYPTDPLSPSGLDIEGLDPVYSSESISGKMQYRSSSPQRYEPTFSFPLQTKAEFSKVDSFISYIQNTSEPFYVALPNMAARGEWLGNPRIKGALQTGRDIITDGWEVDIFGVIADGDFFKIEGSDKIYKAVGDHNSDVNGESVVAITPRLQFTPADDAAIIFVNPEMKVNLAGAHKYAVKPPLLHTYQMDVIEVIE